MFSTTPQHAHADFLAEAELLAHVRHRHFLRRGDDERAGDAGVLQVLHDGEVLVGRPGRRVHDEEIHRPPLRVLQELFDQSVFPRPAPDDGVVRVGEQKADGHHRQVLRDVHGLPPAVALMHVLAFLVEHDRRAGAADVDVQQAHILAGVRREPVRQLRGERALPDAALAGKHQNLVLHVPQTLGDRDDVGVDALGRGRARLLVGAPGARGGSTRRFGVRAGTRLVRVRGDVGRGAVRRHRARGWR
jgi:hypothetical protein